MKRFAFILSLLVSGGPALADGCSSPSFAAASTYQVGRAPVSVVVGDFNGDGKPDLAVANAESDTISVLLADGDGGFQSRGNYNTAASSPSSVAAGDFNGDGKTDLVVANRGRYDSTTSSYTNSAVVVLLGNGDGTFQAGVTFGVGKQESLFGGRE